MQVIHRTSKEVGSYDWELPELVAQWLDALADNDRQEILDSLGNLIDLQLELICIALRMEGQQLSALNAMSAGSTATAYLLADTIRRHIGKLEE